MHELKPAGAQYASGEFREALSYLHAFWTRIPEPKVETLNSYMVIEYGVACALKLGDLDEASTWAELAPPYKEKRHDVGEVEFLIGKVAFARGDMAFARENFLIAKRKSRGRLLKGADERYLALIK